MTRTLLLCLLCTSVGCIDDPVYFTPTPAGIEINNPNGAGAPLATVILPIRVETMEQAARRQEIADQYGLLLTDVPTVRRDQFDLSIDWTVKNLDDAQGRATVSVNGANEFFAFDPSVFVINPLQDEEPPPLMGGAPVIVPPRSYVSGTFSEQDLADASQDLDAITRAGLVPQAAVLTTWRTGDIDDSNGAITLPLPSAAVASILQLDVSLSGNTHMVLEYVLRVRDHSGRLVSDPEEAANAALVPPSTVVFQPPPPPMM